MDALFMATSAVCVTGLASIDPGTSFSLFGQAVMLLLIQLGGLGITTYATLMFYLWSRRISLTDRLAVGQVLLNDPAFHLGRFLQRVVAVMLGLELAGAALLHALAPQGISPFQALFLAVSAFCNAGFTLWPDNMMQWRDHWGVNVVVMSLIILGGLGFAVLDELLRCAPRLFRRRRKATLANARGTHVKHPKLSYHARLVIGTSLFLILAGALLLMLPEYFANDEDPTSLPGLALPSLFQSVSARTAGFNSVDIARLSDVSLLTLICLMFIGGSPGSCAGGFKTTSFRILCAFAWSQLRGRRQVSVAGRGVNWHTLNKVFVLLTFAGLTLGLATYALSLSEGGSAAHGKTPFQVLDLFFEAVSAFATVGYSTNVTPSLSDTGKCIDCLLMFIGRLGPIWLVTTVRQFQTDQAYRLPDIDLPVG
jgi:trk system potassium uptake protein TrkH